MQYTIPLCVVVAFTLLRNFFAVFVPRFTHAVVIIVLVSSFLWGIHSGVSYAGELSDFKQRQAYMPFFNHIQAELPRDCVIVVAEDTERLTRLIPAFTHCNVYISTYLYFNVPEDRIRHNYLTLLRLRGVPVERVNEYLRSRVTEVNAHFYNDWEEAFSRRIDEKFEAKIQKLSNDYAEFMQQDFRGLISKYRIDYIVSAGPLDARLIDELDLTLVKQFEALYLYSMIPR